MYCNVGGCFLLLPCVDSYVILSSVQLIYGEKQYRRIIVSKLGLHHCLRSSNSKPMLVCIVVLVHLVVSQLVLCNIEV